MIELHFENGVKMGELIQDVDGYYKFFPEHRGGYWDEYSLQYVLDKLKEINKPWDDHLQETLK